MRSGGERIGNGAWPEYLGAVSCLTIPDANPLFDVTQANEFRAARRVSGQFCRSKVGFADTDRANRRTAVWAQTDALVVAPRPPVGLATPTATPCLSRAPCQP